MRSEAFQTFSLGSQLMDSEVSILKALPFKEVEKTRPLLVLIDFTVKDSLDLVFLIIIQFQWQRRVLDAMGDGARVGGLQQ